MCASDTCGLQGQCVGAGNCPYSTNVACDALPGHNCEAWQHATCRGGFCMCDAETQCANNSMCLPKRPTIRPGPPLGSPRLPPHRALVLSGGGAKGAFELGVLRGICSRPERADLRGWDMILGTSIGALGAGLLAQYPKEVQCSQGIEQLRGYWGAVRTAEDVWMGNSQNTALLNWNPQQRPVCLASYSPHTWSTNMHAFNQRGGLCDPSPGSVSFEFEVNATAIRTSGVRLRVPAVSITTGRHRWWNETSENIVEGCQASGSLAPVVFPKRVEGEWYIDGGFYSNTPIIKALEDGATDVLAIILDPVERPHLGALDNITAEFGFKGFSIMEFELELMQYLYFTGRELDRACDKRRFPDVTIRGYVPATTIGGVADFDHREIVRMETMGLNITRGEPVDLCELFNMERHEGLPPTVGLAHEDGPPGVVLAAAHGGAATAVGAEGQSAWLCLVACVCFGLGFLGRALSVSRSRGLDAA